MSGDFKPVLKRLGVPDACISLKIEADAKSAPLVTCTFHAVDPDGNYLTTGQALAEFAEEFVMIPRDIYDRLPAQLHWIIENRQKYGPSANRAFRLEITLL